MGVVKVELLHVDDCPSWQVMAARLDQLAGELRFSWSAVLVDTWEESESRRFHGSPSLHIDGVDPFAEPGTPIGLACRFYPSLPGGPDRDTLREALLAATGPHRRSDGRVTVSDGPNPALGQQKGRAVPGEDV